MILADDTTRYPARHTCGEQTLLRSLVRCPVRSPLVAVAVRGPSMAPALRHGDLVLAWRGVSRPPRVRPGDVVLARFRSRRNVLVVKRAVRRQDGGWWLAGDNPYGTDDSSAYGVADVVARVVWRYWPPARFGPLRTVD